MLNSDLAIPHPSMTSARKRRRRVKTADKRMIDHHRDQAHGIRHGEVNAREQWLAAFAHCPFF